MLHGRLPSRATLLAVLALLSVACSEGGSKEEAAPVPANTLAAGAPEGSGHRRMLAILEGLAREENSFVGKTKLRSLRRQLRAAKATPDVDALGHWRVRFELGQVELNHGNEGKAIRLLTEAYELLPEVDFSATRSRIDVGDRSAYFSNATRIHLGVAYMRLGETENCCQRYNQDSCILPFRGAGVHVEQRGSRQAIRYFSEVLENRPSLPDFREQMECEKPALWLLNIAYMTLGEYPESVPEAYLIDMDRYRSDIDFPRFRNVGPLLGLDTFNLSGGVVVDDFDGDDYLDILTSTYDPAGQMHFFRNERDGTFSERTEEAGLTGILGGLNLVQADYDNDGATDVFVFRGAWFAKQGRHPNSLLRNDGRARFTDVTFEAGLGDVHYPCKTGGWADYDNDGDLDLYIGNESTPDLLAPAQLFRNNGDGTFTDVADGAGLKDTLFVNGASWGDYDGDRFPDLFVSTGFSNPLKVLEGGGPNRLYHNNGDGTFEEVGESAGVIDPVAGFPCWFWDFDNDSNLDIFASCSSGPVATLFWRGVGFDLSQLYRGDGSGGFMEVSSEMGLGFPSQPMGANFGDLNNDGYLDFYLGTGNIQYSELRPNVMFLNDRGKGFLNVTLNGGFGHLQKGHGISFADLDNDGDCDVYAQMGGAWPGDKFNDALFENPGFDNHYLTVELEGRRSNRSAIGARIRVDIVENGQPRSIYRHVNSGGSFGCNPLRQTIGVGKAASIRSLEIHWPTSDTTQTFHDVDTDLMIRIVEGEESFRRMDLTTFRLGGG